MENSQRERKRIEDSYTSTKNKYHDIGRKFCIEKCVIQIMRSRKRQITEGIELVDQERIRTLREKET